VNLCGAGLESRRDELRHVINDKQPQTAVGRLHKMKAEAYARDFNEQLSETKKLSQEERQKLQNEVKSGSNDLMGSLGGALGMLSGKR